MKIKGIETRLLGPFGGAFVKTRQCVNFFIRYDARRPRPFRNGDRGWRNNIKAIFHLGIRASVPAKSRIGLPSRMPKLYANLGISVFMNKINDPFPGSGMFVVPNPGITE